MTTRARANTYNFLVASFVVFGSFTYGYNSSVFAGVIGLPAFYAYFNIDAASNSGAAYLGALNGVYLAGGAIGAWTVAWLADKLGRKACIQVICAICIVTAAIQCGSVHIAMLLVGRLFNGFGIGMVNTCVPVYLSEIAPARQRGRLVGLHGCLVVAGYSCGTWTSLGTYFESRPAVQWRLPLGLQILTPLLLVCGSFWMPESPRWLIGRDRYQEGVIVLENLHRTPEDPEAREARIEYQQIKSQLELEAREHLGGLISMFKKPSMRKRLIYGFYLQWLLQSTGVLVIFNYQTILYKTLGVTGWQPLLLLSIYNLIASSLNFVNSLLLDRFGRIRIITIGLIGCVIMMSCYTAFVATYAGTNNRVGNAFAIVLLFFFAIPYAGCLDASSYVYCSEIFPTAFRAHGVGFSVSGLFLSNIVYQTVAPTAFAHVGWKYYLVFIIIPAVGLYPIVKYYPETRGLSLEEVSAKFGDTVALEVGDKFKDTEQEVETVENTSVENKGTHEVEKNGAQRLHAASSPMYLIV